MELDFALEELPFRNTSGCGATSPAVSLGAWEALWEQPVPYHGQ